jgi:Protein of unknown function (DUF1344)
MIKAVGLAIALTFTLSMVTAAEETRGTIRSTNAADHSIVLDDGTRLWVSEGQFADLWLGDQVQAVYETEADKNVVTQMYRRPPAPDRTSDPLESVQAGDN